MKFLTLKTKIAKAFLLLALAGSFGANKAWLCAAENIGVNATENYIVKILEACLDTNDTQRPFYWFVEELLRITNEHANELEKRWEKVNFENFVRDLHRVRELKSPASAMKIGRILLRYKKFMPDSSIKRRKLPDLLNALKFRLSVTGDGNFDKAFSEEVSSENSQQATTENAPSGKKVITKSYLKALMAYFMLLYELGKEYLVEKIAWIRST